MIKTTSREVTAKGVDTEEMTTSLVIGKTVAVVKVVVTSKKTTRCLHLVIC